MTRILVTGNREHSPDIVSLAILSVVRDLNIPDRITFIHGAARARRTPMDIYEGDYSRGQSAPAGATCKGADLGCEWAARILGANVWRFPAEWEVYGKRAGRVRNQEMLDDTQPDLVLAFPVGESPGTRHMMSIASKAGVRVLVWEP